jgi:cellulose synthase/poly-beta-1,6-N-acetylglucosamine synthase-like glycosyltransferase
MLDILPGIFEWIHNDYKSNRIRFCLEVLAWAISIGCAITMATTVPNPPLLVLYPIWIAGCAIYAWCAYSRRSFGMLANYILLVTIDTVGLTRMLLS